MKFLLIAPVLVLISFACSIDCIAQNLIISTDSSTLLLDVTGDFNKAEIQLPALHKKPDFPGGRKAWQNFLSANFNISAPFANRVFPGTYRVMIRFIINAEGKIMDAGAETNCGYGLETETIRCIKKSPEWIPAETASGHKVAFTLRQFVIFKVSQNNIELIFPQ